MNVLMWQNSEPERDERREASSRSLLTYEGGRLLRDGVPHQVLAGSMHYFRVVPGLWRDRMMRLRDLGVNAVDTYIPWNFHQRRASDEPSFRGWQDVEEFVGIAAGIGLDVVLRPGPYICAEWSNGGLPVWLTSSGVGLRSADPGFTDAVARWFEVLLPRLTPLQAAHGGPVVAFQVENEFGSFGDDSAYTDWLAAVLRSHGVVEMLYTADGPTDVMQDGGSIPGVLAAATLGSQPARARRLLAQRREGEPFFVAEFWNGWFDHWGHPHHVRNAADAAAAVAQTLHDDGSISLYMAHGGTNFGLWSGANMVDGQMRGTITSYDSDAPIAEDGRLTAKFFAIREALGATDRPLMTSPPRFLPATTIPLELALSLTASLEALSSHHGPHAGRHSFDELDVHAGIVQYDADVLLPARPVDVSFTHVADRAIVFLDGVEQGIIAGHGTLTVTGSGNPSHLMVLVESLGRVNYGPDLGAPKGLLGSVLVERRQIQRWTTTALAIEDIVPSTITFADPEPGTISPTSPGLFRGTLGLVHTADTHVRLPGYSKGYLWVNDTLLGRYWSIGPQQTLYLPAPLLHTGTNTFHVLELHTPGADLHLGDTADLGPEEHYVEEF